ncbi:MAG: hypothetical protein PUA70_07510 [Oribacterium sp.]|nr:hypothetical protein [Oribacterium sp.]
MIVPMKKVSLLILEEDKRSALKALRKLGLVHMEEVQGSGDKLQTLKAEADKLSNAVSILEDVHNKKLSVPQQSLTLDDALNTAENILAISESKKALLQKRNQNISEIERVAKWGDFHPEDFDELRKKGIILTPYEMPKDAYRDLDQDLKTIRINADKSSVRFLLMTEATSSERPETLPPSAQEFLMPAKSISEMRSENIALEQQLKEKDHEIDAKYSGVNAMKEMVLKLQREIIFETLDSGAEKTVLSDKVSLAGLTGYIPTEDLPQLEALAKKQCWGLVSEDPTPEDNVPTKLRNNKFVSLIYPLTDFLGTVPGYFEFDISSWFLGFILIFFGIIFGDGGYGLLITGCALALIIKAKAAGKEVQPIYLLLGLFGIVTIIWGAVTCSWFGIPAESVPVWLQKLSVPVLSNVNESRIWYPFWTDGKAGLTTAQNLQIFCFALALIQLTIAHLIVCTRCYRSLSLIGQIGNILELWGMFYVVLTLVVNGAVFGLDRVIAGIPVGKISITLVAVGFVMNFIFGSYEGSIKASILDSLKNIISILLGVVNVFSDIVSYIRLWAVGLAGAAISSTVNQMAGPMLGHLTLILFAVILLVFGHGLNIILNVLSLIVHGVRLNTLEFSSHLGMSWSGHKYEPFK